MSLSFYDASVATYQQTLGGMNNVLAKGEAAAAEGTLALDELVRYRLRDDMAPFTFQVISVWHHSKGALEGMKAGVFEPPPRLSDMNYDGLRGLVNEALDYLSDQGRGEIDALAEGSMVFRLGGREIPFSNRNFLLSFSLPNFFFHATTVYDMLRIKGVVLGKMDFLGQLRTTAG